MPAIPGGGHDPLVAARPPIDVLRALLPASAKKYGAEQNILLEGDVHYQVVGIVSGVARCFQISATGRRHIGRFAGAGSVIGLDLNAVCRFSAEAITNCEAVVFKMTSVKYALESSGLIRRAIIQALTDELAQKERAAFRLARLNADQKVADFLLEISEEANRKEVVLDMPRNDLADHLGITLETVSRSLHKLQRMGLLHFNDTRRLTLTAGQALRDFMNRDTSEASHWHPSASQPESRLHNVPAGLRSKTPA